MQFDRINKEMMEEIRNRKPNLKTLNLSTHNIEKIEHLELLSSLERLNISSNKIGSLTGLNGNSKLTELNLSNNCIKTCEGISRLTALEVLNLADNEIAEIEEIQRFKVNISLKELDLTGNPVCDLDDYREQVLHFLPNLKMLDKIPVIKNEAAIRERSKNRKQIEDVIGKFLKTKIPPKSIEKSTEIQAPFKNTSLSNIPEEHKRHISDLPSLVDVSRAESHKMQKEHQSMNYSLGQDLKAPLITLERQNNDQKDVEKSGLFSFINSKNIDTTTNPAKDSLKEIIAIQEEFIKKKSSNLVPELLKVWRNKVFELLFENKKSDLLNIQKSKLLESENKKLADDIDQMGYLLQKSQKELEACQYEMDNAPNEYEQIMKNYKATLFKQVKEILTKHDQETRANEERVEDSLYALQSYFKRLQIVEKRIRTYAQLVQSERESYKEKYKQFQKNQKNNIKAEDDNFQLSKELKEVRRAMEEKDHEIATLKREILMEKESYQTLSQTKNIDTERTVNEALLKVKNIDSTNQALKSDNERLITRIKEHENDLIGLRTDLATHTKLKESEINNVTHKLQNELLIKDQNIQSLNLKIEQLNGSNQLQLQRLEKMQEELAACEKSFQNRLSTMAQEKDYTIESLKSKIKHLEEENKVANERLMRKMNFQESLFGAQEERINTHPRPQRQEVVNQSEDFNIANDFPPQHHREFIASHDFARGPPIFGEGMKVPQGTKENPIELQPVRISTSNSHQSVDLNAPSPSFSKVSNNSHPSQRSMEEFKKPNGDSFGSISGPQMVNQEGHQSRSNHQTRNEMHTIHTMQNERSWQNPMAMSRENMPEYSFIPRTNQ
ncbi:unnamed protein product [Moneuplotes crassus]|uniref:Uncharacterized protein n=1 Tax=Euplotes crassus TaxID=5936 RepID=A0AAD1Y765_EUPCR|nr:unnamed protein product [Moneuplotes crassus]